MLMKKQMHKGLRIQLPKSMKKVDAARQPKNDKVGYLVICKAGVDPSSNNVHMGRLPYIDSDPSVREPPKSFRPKKLSKPMIRLFRALGVPKDVMNDYVKGAYRRKGEIELPQIRHAFLRGVADPTGSIPSGCVFLTGFRNTETLDEYVFITRCPCIKACDGRLVEVLKTRPTSMSQDHYDFLRELPFGIVIFGFPKEGMKPLPETIANGDLDGDRYFLCWDKKILKHLDPPLLEQEGYLNIAESPDHECTNDESVYPCSNWFRKAQDAMVNLQSIDTLRLIGKLHTAAMKISESDSELGLRNPDAEGTVQFQTIYFLLYHLKIKKDRIILTLFSPLRI